MTLSFISLSQTSVQYLITYLPTSDRSGPFFFPFLHPIGPGNGFKERSTQGAHLSVTEQNGPSTDEQSFVSSFDECITQLYRQQKKKRIYKVQDTNTVLSLYWATTGDVELTKFPSHSSSSSSASQSTRNFSRVLCCNLNHHSPQSYLLVVGGVLCRGLMRLIDERTMSCSK